MRAQQRVLPLALLAVSAWWQQQLARPFLVAQKLGKQDRCLSASERLPQLQRHRFFELARLRLWSSCWLWLRVHRVNDTPDASSGEEAEHLP